MTAAVSVIVPFRNEARHLPRQLEALANQRTDSEVEIILVDNGSVDGSVDIARRFVSNHNGSRLVYEPGLGINYARNAGATSASAPLLLYCDADDVADHAWVQSYLGSAHDWDLAGGHLDLGKLNSQPHPDRIEASDLPVALGFLRYAVGANMAVRREAWLEIGGFDPRYRRGATEIEFCWRAQLAGLRLGYEPGALMYYRLRENTRAAAHQAFAWGRADVQLRRQFGLPVSALLDRAGPTQRIRRRTVHYSLSYALGIAHGATHR